MWNGIVSLLDHTNALSPSHDFIDIVHGGCCRDVARAAALTSRRGTKHLEVAAILPAETLGPARQPLAERRPRTFCLVGFQLLQGIGD